MSRIFRYWASITSAIFLIGLFPILEDANASGYQEFTVSTLERPSPGKGFAQNTVGAFGKGSCLIHDATFHALLSTPGEAFWEHRKGGAEWI